MKKGKRKSILAKLLSCVMVLQVAASFGASSYAAESESGTSVTPIFNPDYAQLIGRSDISYTGCKAFPLPTEDSAVRFGSPQTAP